MKQRSNGNFFSLPNEIFLLGLRPGELAVYSYLRRCEDRGTHPVLAQLQDHWKSGGHEREHSA